MAERDLPKVEAAGSIPVSRSISILPSPRPLPETPPHFQSAVT